MHANEKVAAVEVEIRGRLGGSHQLGSRHRAKGATTHVARDGVRPVDLFQQVEIDVMG